MKRRCILPGIFSRKKAIIICLLIIFSFQGGCGQYPDPLLQIPEESIPSDNFSTPGSPPPYEQNIASDNFTSPPQEKETPEVLSDEKSFLYPYQSSAILVRFDPKSDSLPLKSHTSIGAHISHDYEEEGVPGLQLISLPEQLSVEEAVAYYQKQPGVVYAEPDYYRFSNRIPADPDFWRQWGLLNTGQVYREEIKPGISGADLNATAAWDKVTGGSSIIAVLDSGVDYLHPDLASNIWTDQSTGTYGYDAITGEPEPMDITSHGTHSAGIIGAVGDDGLGISGVNWNTRIMPVRFLNSFGTGTISDEIESILWATSHGARIISCSYGAATYSRAEYDVMKESDALFICAAGNSGLDADVTPHYPAGLDLPNIISVAATDSSDTLASFSDFGAKTVDLAAPGVDIYSTMHNIYKPVPIWTEPFDNLQNWTLHGNWTLDRIQNVSPNTSIMGVANGSTLVTPRVPARITLNSPLKVTGIANPVLSYEWSLVATNYSFMIEGSDDGVTWLPLEYGRGKNMTSPFMQRECKVPTDLRGGHLFIRFSIDGDSYTLNLDDITLSDGFGDLIETRWGYMNGTSAACPQVSGIAGLLIDAAPDASLADVRSAILTTTDPLPSLSGRTVTGGRANLAAALEQITGGSTYHLRLRTGWNHISVPYRIIADNNTAGEIFGSLTNVSGHSLYRFDAGNWISVRPEEEVSPLISYWVFTGSPASLPLKVDPDQTGFFSRNLTTGWNGIGIIGEESGEAKEVLSPLSDIWSYIVGFNATIQMSDEPIISGGSGRQNDTRPLMPYQGYWIYMTRDGLYQKNESRDINIVPDVPPLWPQPLR